MSYPQLKTKYRISGCVSCQTTGCEICGNTGRIMQIDVDWFVDCEECEGLGELEIYDGPLDSRSYQCPECLGTGDIPLSMAG